MRYPDTAMRRSKREKKGTSLPTSFQFSLMKILSSSCIILYDNNKFGLFFHLDWLGSQGHIITLPSVCLGFFLVIASRFREFAARQKTTKGERERGGRLLWLCVIVCGAQQFFCVNESLCTPAGRGQGRENNARADPWQILHCSDSHELTGRMNEGRRGGEEGRDGFCSTGLLIDWLIDFPMAHSPSVCPSVCLSVLGNCSVGWVQLMHGCCADHPLFW